MVYILENRWQDWIKDNFLRGCSKSSMLEVMLQSGIPQDTAEFNLTLYEAAQRPESNLQALPRTRQASNNTTSTYLFQHENTITTSDGQTMHVTMRNDAPDVAVLDHFMSSEECDALCELSKDSLTKSEVVDDITGKGVMHQDRTSQGTYFDIGQYPLVEKIEKRISELTSIPVSHGEGIQILNYVNGGEYKPHFDYFPDNDGGRANMAQGGQRIITIVMYLNDVEAGGATIFPEINLSVYPKKGSALYFSYFQSGGTPDALTLHGGAPVLEGEKWIATKWLREHPYR